MAMLPNNHLMKVRNHFLTQLIRAQSDTKFVAGDFEAPLKVRQNIVIDVVHTQIKMLELWILNGYPYLDSLPIIVFSSDLFNIVENRHNLLRLFTCF